MKPAEENIVKVSRHRSCRMIRNQGCGGGALSENPDDSCNVGHVVFGDQLIFGDRL